MNIYKQCGCYSDGYTIVCGNGWINYSLHMLPCARKCNLMAQSKSQVIHTCTVPLELHTLELSDLFIGTASRMAVIGTRTPVRLYQCHSAGCKYIHNAIYPEVWSYHSLCRLCTQLSDQPEDRSYCAKVTEAVINSLGPIINS